MIFSVGPQFLVARAPPAPAHVSALGFIVIALRIVGVKRVKLEDATRRPDIGCRARARLLESTGPRDRVVKATRPS
jgi:hypothetical protein